MDTLGIAVLANLLLFLLKKRRNQLSPESRRRRLIIIAGVFLAQQALDSEWFLPRSTVRYPSVGVKTHGAESEFWGEELFDDMFRLRKAHFFRIMDAMRLRNKTLFCGRKRKGHVPQQARRICAKQAHRVPSALHSRSPEATRPPSSATAGRGPAQGRTCVCRHRRVTIAARPARHAHLAQRVRPPRPRPAEGRLRAAWQHMRVPPTHHHHGETGTSSASHLTRPPSPSATADGLHIPPATLAEGSTARPHHVPHCWRVAFVRDGHIKCRPLSAVALPGRAGGGPHSKAAPRTTDESRSQRDEHTLCRSRDATALPSHGRRRARTGRHIGAPPPARHDRSETSMHRAARATQPTPPPPLIAIILALDPSVLSFLKSDPSKVGRGLQISCTYAISSRYQQLLMFLKTLHEIKPRHNMCRCRGVIVSPASSRSGIAFRFFCLC